MRNGKAADRDNIAAELLKADMEIAATELEDLFEVIWNTEMIPGESSREYSFHGVKVPGNCRSRERKFPLGTFAPISENTGERKVLIPNIHSLERTFPGTFFLGKIPGSEKSLNRQFYTIDIGHRPLYNLIGLKCPRLN